MWSIWRKYLNVKYSIGGSTQIPQALLTSEWVYERREKLHETLDHLLPLLEVNFLKN